jgi:hypothetical protein
MSYSSGLRRTLRVLPLPVALALALIAAPAALAAGPNPYLQINDLPGRVVGGLVQLGASTDPAVAGGELPFGAACAGLAVGEYPADSVGALLTSHDPTWAIGQSGFNNTLTIGGITYDAASLGFLSEAPGWQLWVNNSYFNFGQDMAAALCSPTHTGDVVVLQATERHFADGDTMYGLPTTPQVRVEAVPLTIAPGQSVTATVAEFAPGSEGISGWGSNGVSGTRSVTAGYGLGFDGSTTFAATDAQGRATATVPADASGTINLIAIAGTDRAALPTASHNSAFSVPVSACVYDGSASSPCSGSLSAPAIDLGSQARGTIGAATPVVVTPALGHVAITAAKLVSGDVDDFLLTSDGCSGATVVSGDGSATPSCSVRVRFAPSVAGARSAVLRITSDGMSPTLDVTITGTGGAAAAGTPGPAGENGGRGDTGAPGATGATGATGANGAAGPSGLAGVTGPAGPQGKAGRDAVCTVKRTKGAPKVTCKLTTTKSTKATLTRLGRVYARGTVASLRATRRVPAGSYTLRYRSQNKAVTQHVTIV